MILTYKIKHKRDFSEELRKARKVAELCIKHHTQNRGLNPLPKEKSDFFLPSPCLSSLSASSSELSPDFLAASSTPLSFDSLSVPDSFPDYGSISPRDVKHIGLKSIISGQILRKCSHNQNFRSGKNVKLIIPSRAISIDRKERILRIPCLKLLLNYHFSGNFKKISQIEIDNTYAYVAVVFPDEKPESSGSYIGVDRNTKGHIAVVADPNSGKIWKLGKMRHHTNKKYENIKNRLKKRGKNKQLKAVKQREKNIVKDLNHKISRKIVEVALYNGCGIKLENLKGIKKLKNKIQDAGKSNINKSKAEKREQNGDKSKSNRINKNLVKNESSVKKESRVKKLMYSNEYSLNNWSFHQLQQFIEYKARLRGVEVVYIDPHATSKKCSRCGLTGNRHSKRFECPHCGHVDHADVNAAFNIALTPKGIGQFPVERDAGKGSTDTPRKIPDRTTFRKSTASEETSPQFAWEVCQFFD